jgi:hypothetical protein
MARLRLEIGPLSAEVTAPDAQAAEMLRMFAYATGASRQAPNQQLANHVVAELLQYMRLVARQRFVTDAAEAAESEAEQIIGLGGPVA